MINGYVLNSEKLLVIKELVREFCREKNKIKGNLDLDVLGKYIQKKNPKYLPFFKKITNIYVIRVGKVYNQITEQYEPYHSVEVSYES